jgi:tetratricopeptide (TPR) repeat protein
MLETIPILVLLVCLATIYMLGIELGVVAGVIAAAAVAWSVPRGWQIRVAVFLVFGALPGVAYYEHVRKIAGEDNYERALAFEARADAILHTRGDAEAAVVPLEEAVRLRPTFFALHKLGWCRLRLGQTEQALKTLQAAAALAPAPAAKLYKRGLTWLQAGRAELGLAALDSAYVLATPVDAEPS